MMTPPDVALDSRNADQFAEVLTRRKAGFVPEWQPQATGPDAAIIQIAARYLQTIVQRLNQAPDKNKLAFLDMLGLQLVPAASASAPIVFTLAPNAAAVHLPAGTQVAAPPPPNGTNQIVFETTQGIGLSPATLKSVVSVSPADDQFVDHSSDAQAMKPFQLFAQGKLQATPHVLYLAHDTLLALAGKSTVQVTFNLTTPSSQALDIIWCYWDGKVWREFRSKVDSTGGLTRSGMSFILETDSAETAKTTVNGTEAYWISGQLNQPLPPSSALTLPEVDGITLSASMEGRGLRPDLAFSGALPLDVTKPFYPFGMQPQPGAAFYFSNQEAFGKPGAELTIHVTLTPTPYTFPHFPLRAHPPHVFPLVPRLSWEYWNGSDWTALHGLHRHADPFEDHKFSEVKFRVPKHWAATPVNGQNGLWMRVVLISEGFGYRQTITWTDSSGKTNHTTIVVSQPPAVSDFRLDYVWPAGHEVAAEHVVTYNDFKYEDDTQNAKVPGSPFQPFKLVSDLTPAMYLGFDKQLVVDQVAFFLDIVEQPGDTQGPPLVWEYWDGGTWQPMPVVDQTQNLRQPGMVSFIGPADALPVDQFDESQVVGPLFWFRARLKENGSPGQPTVNAIYNNAVQAIQRQTTVNEPLGASNGASNQVFSFRQVPVLEGEWIEVRESGGLPANVEWRIIALDVFSGDQAKLAALAAMLAGDGTQTDIQLGDVHLVRDRLKQVTEVWIHWYGEPDLLGSGPNNRHYTVDRARGRVSFGDGKNGAIPASGAAIVARSYLTGGGSAGNVAAQQITQVLGALGGVESATNPQAAQGGAGAQPPASLAVSGPQMLRNRGRALTLQDFEALALQADSNVAFARAIPCRDGGGRTVPGWVTLIIVPQSADPQPVPSSGLCAAVQQFVAEQACAELAAVGQIYVTGPDYLAVDVNATLLSSADADPGLVQQTAQTAVATFLDPLQGGPDGRGWPPGRPVYLSDLAAALKGVEGLDYVEELGLAVDGAVQGDQIPVAADQIVVVGNLTLNVTEAPT